MFLNRLSPVPNQKEESTQSSGDFNYLYGE